MGNARVERLEFHFRHILESPQSRPPHRPSPTCSFIPWSRFAASTYLFIYTRVLITTIYYHIVSIYICAPLILDYRLCVACVPCCWWCVLSIIFTLLYVAYNILRFTPTVCHLLLLQFANRGEIISNYLNISCSFFFYEILFFFLNNNNGLCAASCDLICTLWRDWIKICTQEQILILLWQKK